MHQPISDVRWSQWRGLESEGVGACVSKAAAGGATELAKHEQGLESEREKRVGVSKRMPTVSK